MRYDHLTGEIQQTIPKGVSDQERVALNLAFDLWIAEGACSHPSMCIADEHISNWSGLRAFQDALRGLDVGSYATLLREIPDGNDGLTTPADARICLGELEIFGAAGSFGQIVELVERGSGETIHSRTESYAGWIGTTGATGISYRLTADGIFQIEIGQTGVICHDADAKVLFHSTAFSQPKTPAGVFRLTDLSSGKQIVCSDGLRDAFGYYPFMFEVKQNKDNPARYAYGVEPLRRVFHAAVDTGHPVLWS